MRVFSLEIVNYPDQGNVDRFRADCTSVSKQKEKVPTRWGPLHKVIFISTETNNEWLHTEVPSGTYLSDRLFQVNIKQQLHWTEANQTKFARRL
jgi:hypothetical protein